MPPGEAAARPNLQLVSDDQQSTLFPAPPVPAEISTALVCHKRSAAEIVAALGDDLLRLRNETKASKQRLVARSVLAGIVFAYWSSRFDHPRALLDPKRETRLIARLAECGDNVSDLLWALDGARKDKWVMGAARNSERKVDELETILLDRAHVERFGEQMKGFRENEPHPLALKYGLNV